MSRRRRAQVAGAGIISGLTMVATLTLFFFAPSIVGHLPEKWWFVAPFVLACIGLLFLFQRLNNRL